MNKCGTITQVEYDSLKLAADKYYNKHKSALHPNWKDGVEYVLKHLNVEKIATVESNNDTEMQLALCNNCNSVIPFNNEDIKEEGEKKYVKCPFCEGKINL